MILQEQGRPLVERALPVPEPGPHQVLVQIEACAVCRTDLHVLDGDLKQPKLPLIPGHEIIGRITGCGPKVTMHRLGERVGIPWLGYTCGECGYCRRGQENLCANAAFTGYTLDGGYAEFTVADERYCFALPAGMTADSAPLLCAGLIGWRSLKACGDAKRIGVYGFGAAAHVITQVAVHLGRDIFAFTKDGDLNGQTFARTLGARWAGGSTALPPEPLDAAIIFAPVGSLVPLALSAVAPGGVVVCGGIHMSPIPSFDYRLLWGERKLCSIANLTRSDGIEFLALAAQAGVQCETVKYALGHANMALSDLRQGNFNGAAILLP